MESIFNNGGVIGKRRVYVAPAAPEEPAPSGWEPTQLSTLLGWYDASDASTITLNGSNVSQWNDKSGNDVHVNQTIESRQPIYENGVTDAIYFEGEDTGDVLNADPAFGVIGDPDIAFVMFVKPDNTAGDGNGINNRIIGLGGNDGLGLHGAWGDNGYSWRHQGGTEQYDGFTQAEVESDSILVYTKPTGNFNTDELFRNGVEVTPTSSGSSSTGPAYTTDLFAIGAPNSYTTDYSDANGAWGWVYEVIVLNSNNTEERQKCEGYLAHKWEQTALLPSDHPYKNSPPTSGTGTNITATGGTVTDITDGGTDYRVHTFTSSGTFEVTSGSGDVEYLVVAGGGSGGSAEGNTGTGGGGAGGLLNGTISVSTQLYSITIGAGGAVTSTSVAKGNNGQDSSALGFTAIGGGGGGGEHNDFASNILGDGLNGGSGGGGSGGFQSSDGQGGSGTTNQGNDGANGVSSTSDVDLQTGGGGGGASTAGSTGPTYFGGDGGDGLEWPTGSSDYYAGGGAGGKRRSDNGQGAAGSGGIGGGGDGALATDSGATAQSGSVNTGGGGGGSGGDGGNGPKGGAGGSGIVIIRYPI